MSHTPLADIHEVGERLLTQWLALFRALGTHASDNDAVVRLAASLTALLREECGRGQGRVLIVADSGCVFVHGDMLRLNRQGYARARAFVENLVAVTMNEIEVTSAVTDADVIAFTQAWRGATTRMGDPRAWPVVGLPLSTRLVPSHIAQDEAGRQHRGRILEEWMAFRSVLRNWNAEQVEGRAGPAVVARRILQRLVDHELRDPGYLLGIALFAPDGAEPAPRAALLAATLGARAGVSRTTARASGMVATYLAIGMPPVSATDEIDSWNAHYGLPAAQEWILRAAIEHVRAGRGRDLPLPVEVLLGTCAHAIASTIAASTPRRALASYAAHWPGANDDPAYAGLGGAIDRILYEGLPGALGTVEGQTALRRGLNDVVVQRADGSIAVVAGEAFVEVDTAGPAPCAWYGFDAWPADEDEPTFTSA